MVCNLNSHIVKVSNLKDHNAHAQQVWTKHIDQNNKNIYYYGNKVTLTGTTKHTAPYHWTTAIVWGCMGIFYHGWI